MKIIPPGGASGSGPSRRDFTYRERPHWLIEWIANKGKYAELSCGCLDCISDHQPIIKVGGRKAEVWCEVHSQPAIVVKAVPSSRYTEWKYGIKSYRVPDTPPF